jgi:hypothetical protein
MLKGQTKPKTVTTFYVQRNNEQQAIIVARETLKEFTGEGSGYALTAKEAITMALNDSQRALESYTITAENEKRFVESVKELSKGE